MSRPLDSWFTLPELDGLARREAVLEGELVPARLTRLTELLNDDSGSVKVRLRFQQPRDNCVILQLRCNGWLELLCQRCLEPTRHEIEIDVRYGLLEAGADEAGLPAEVETFVLDGDRFNPARLIEDELIVSLPLAAKHSSVSDCGSLVHALDGADQPVEGAEGRQADPVKDTKTDGAPRASVASANH